MFLDRTTCAQYIGDVDVHDDVRALGTRTRGFVDLRGTAGDAQDCPTEMCEVIFQWNGTLEAHRVGICDAPADEDVVERFAVCLEQGDIDGLTRLLAHDVWGLVDDGSRRRRPTLGVRAVARQWANAIKRYGGAGEVRRVRLNGEASLLVCISGYPLASLHLETRDELVTSTRALLDPARLARLGIGTAPAA